jgi:hypothetical protein
VFSVFSLTLQASIVNIYKDSKVFKIQKQNNPITEEEEERHDSDESADEVIYLSHDNYYIKAIVLNKQFSDSSQNDYLSLTKSITVPPPKF